MSDVLSTYTFLPWLRQGIANKVTAADLDAGVKLRATINVQLAIQGTAVEGDDLIENVDKDIQLYGPGDIVGIDSKSIVKNEPHHWITNFEPNYLPYIEFYDEDFPWRYTPAAPSSSTDRLRPWITLVILKEDEFKEGKNIKDKPLPFFSLLADAADVFPPSAELWAWAHVHVNEGLMDDIVAKSTDKNSIISNFENILKKNPDLAYSRIVCPRKLEANTGYHAFVIPSFESGRLAGLGLDISVAPYATFSSWDAYTGGGDPKPEGSSFPYYHRWYFRTGTVGDFEYLVRLLKPQPMDSRVGVRDMDVQEPGSNIQGITDEDLGGILKLGGALRIPYATLKPEGKQIFDKYDQWAEPYPHPFQQDLAKFVNLPDDYDEKNAEDANSDTGIDGIQGDKDPLITAPIYGRWHALTKRLLYDKDGNDVPNNTNWVHDLNLDPRWRVPAGYGTGVVQENQENYMNAAWKQIGDVLAANRKMRQAQLAKEVSWFWYNKHIKPITQLSPERSYMLTAPLHKRVLTNGFTVYHQIKQSVVPLSFTSVAMRSITRPGSRMMKTLVFDNQIKKDNLVQRVNNGQVLVVPPKKIPEDLPTLGEVTDDMKPTKIPSFVIKLLLKYPWIRYALLALALILVLLIVLLKPSGLAMTIMGAVAAGLVVLYRYVNQWYKHAAGADAVNEANVDPKQVDKMPKSPNFHLIGLNEKFTPRTGTRDSKEAVSFKTALKDSFSLMNFSLQAGVNPPKPALNFSSMVNATFTAIDPELTIPKLVLNSIFIPERIKLKLIETFVEAMAYPEFDTPMYKPLVDISSELFLPNLNFITPNSISLLETNQRFIESYMVGLNHEFARELLWREYPTDQRGSYFRQFWDVSSFYDDAGTDLETLKEKLRDIPPLHLWSKFSNLGDHDNREQGLDNEEELVLVIRGELLKKYPNAVIYAHKAKWNDDSGEVDLTAERRLADLTDAEKDNPPKTKIKTPLYEAKVDPDIYFFGFDLTATEAKGGPGDSESDNPGWFFVIKERPGEPRFGLDIDQDPTPNVWNDLSWEDILPEGSEGNFIRINNSTPTITLENPETNADTEDDEKIPQYKDDKFVSWNKNMNAAEVAYILYQVPVLVAVHASDMLPE